MVLKVYNVPASTLHDKTHQGPRQAGFKSALTYRGDIGIPGYTGFNPSATCVPLAVKSETAYEGRHVGARQQNLEADDPHTRSLYAAEFQEPKDGSKPLTGTATGIGRHTNATPKQLPGRHTPAAGTRLAGQLKPYELRCPGAMGGDSHAGPRSSYQAELLDGACTATEQLAQSQGLNAVLVEQETARRMQAGGTWGQSTKRLGTGDIIGYKTQYASMADCAQLANYTRNGCPEKMGTGLSSAAVPAGALASTQLAPGPHLYGSTEAALQAAAAVQGQMDQSLLSKQQTGTLGRDLVVGSAGFAATSSLQRSGSAATTVQPLAQLKASAPVERVMGPQFRAKSSYTEDFQTSQAGPKERRADTAEDIKAADTTLDLHCGTTRATHHLPGYGGFIPEASFNKQATEQADLRRPRPDAYNPGQLLFGLDQWSRRRHPDYTGHKPQAARNITPIQLARGPTMATTSGRANFMATRRLATGTACSA